MRILKVTIQISLLLFKFAVLFKLNFYGVFTSLIWWKTHQLFGIVLLYYSGTSIMLRYYSGTSRRFQVFDYYKSQDLAWLTKPDYFSAGVQR